MIYAIRAVGTEYIKFGKARSVGKRLAELETGCPHDLEIIAVADWPDEQEKSVHLYLETVAHKREWFRDGEKAREVIGWMEDRENGLRSILKACGMGRKAWSESRPPKVKKPSIEEEREEWAAVDKIRKEMASLIFGANA